KATAKKEEEKPAAKKATAKKEEPAKATASKTATKATAKKEEEKPAAKKATAKKEEPAKATASKTAAKPAAKKEEAKPAEKPAVKKTAAAAKPEPGDEKRVYHISKRKEDGMWQIKASGGAKAVKLFRTQAEAIDAAVTVAQNQGGRVVVHKANGAFKSISLANYVSKS
ncbi:MAG: DUF2188 domain-containing protein, partial [Clostridia bacterium]|nr:DUF2188 domain-containing protein [Clostridia bacterium]